MRRLTRPPLESDSTTPCRFPSPSLLTLNSPQFVDNLGTLQTLDPSSVTATLDGADLLSEPDWTVDTTSNTITLTYTAGAYSSDADGALLYVTFSATVDDDPTNVKGSSVTNSADLTWSDQNGNPDSIASNEVSTTIVEPNLQIAKTEATATTSVSGGDSVVFDLELTNPSTPGSVSPAHDVTVVDQIPDFVTPASPYGGGTWDSFARTITWTGIDIDPDATVTLTYSASIDLDVPAGTEMTNTADATATSMSGVVTGERDAGAGIGGYAATSSYTLTSINAALTKAVTPEDATIGEMVQYTLEVTIPADTVLWDAAVTDLLPDGVVFDGTVSVACAPACSLPAAELTPRSNPDGTTSLAWWVGDVATSPTDRTITVVYDAHVADVRSDASLVLAGDDLDNSGDFGWNQTDQVATDPIAVADLTAPEENAGESIATLGVLEPSLTITKQVDGADAIDAQPGDSFSYTIVVENTGTSDAHDVTVRDVPDVELTNVTQVTGAAAVVDGWSVADPDIEWFLAGPFSAGTSITLSYTGDLVASGALATSDTVDNTAEIASYFGRPEAERLANPTIDYRTYTGPSDSATVALFFPTATLDKAAVGPSPASVGVPFEWSVTVTNTSAVADIGSVEVSDTLPPNWDFDPSSATYGGIAVGDPTITSSPAGDTLTWSGMSGILAGSSAQLTFTASPTSAAQVDPGLGVNHVNAAQASFSDATGAFANADGPYETNSDTATAQLAVGELGDTIWFDADANGLFDGVDIPLGGVTVDLVWAGPDGDLATVSRQRRLHDGHRSEWHLSLPSPA